MLKIIYDDRALEDMPSIPKADQDAIRDAINKKLSNYPELFGRKLRGKLKDYWKLRVGNYRVGYIPERDRVIIKAIGNRKDIYRLMERRLG